MDLRRRLSRWVLARPRVLLVDCPGNRRLRWEVEALLDRRSWPLALSPADADLLLVLGTPGPRLADAVELLWSQTTSPRHRHRIERGADLRTELDRAVHELIDAEHVTGPARLSPVQLLANRTAAQHGGDDRHHGPDRHTDDPPADAASRDDGDKLSRGEVEEAEQQHVSHEEHADSDEHEGHHMHHGGDVAGLAMAGTAPDRDGLALDELRVTLGPVLPGWPTGLVVGALMQGDVLTQVDVALTDAHGTVAADGGAAATTEVLAMDHLAQFLLIAGWPMAARSARMARSALLSPDPGTAARGRREAARLARRVRRSRTLAWSVRGLGVAPAGATVPTGQWPGGDVLSRVHRWCQVAGDGATPPGDGHQDQLVALSGLLEGAELAAARLIIASVDLDLAAAGQRGGHRCLTRRHW